MHSLFRMCASLCVAAALIAVTQSAVAQEQDQIADAPAVEESPAAAPKLSDAQKGWMEALQGYAPLTPGQVDEARRTDAALDEATLRREIPKNTRSDVVTVSIEPGSSSPTIDLMHGFITSIEVVDASGKPWPVALAEQGDGSAFTVGIVGAAQAEAVTTDPTVDTPAAVGSVVTVAPKRKYASPNLMLVLQNSSRPVSLVLRATEPQADAELKDRVTLVVQALGPFARPAMARGYEHLDATEDLRAALIGRPPAADAQEILSDLPAGMRAWRRGTQLWVRMQDSLISPAPEQSVSGGEFRAYRLRYLPVIVTSSQGHLREVSLQEAAP